MAYGFFYTARPLTKIFLVLFLMVTCYLILFGCGILIAWPLFGTAPAEVISAVESRKANDYLELLAFLQILYSTGLFLLPAILAGFLIQKNTWDFLLANRRLNSTVLVLVILLMIISVPWINYLGYLNEQLSLPDRWSELMETIRKNDEESFNLMKSYLGTDSFGGLLFNLFMIALVPAIGEEFLFRGTLQKIFEEWLKKPQLAIWLVALLFSLAHFQFLGFFPRILLGALFGYLFWWTRNIWFPVIAHFVNNAVGVIYYYMYLQGNLDTDPEKLGMQQNPGIFIMGSLILTLTGLVLIWQRKDRSADAHFT